MPLRRPSQRVPWLVLAASLAAVALVTWRGPHGADTPLVRLVGAAFSLALFALTRGQAAARAQAEANAQRLRLLGEVSAKLGASLDPDAVARDAVALLVPGFADEVTLALGDGPPNAAFSPQHIRAPLSTQTRVLGTLAFTLGPSGRRYRPEDVSFVEELARRAAVAVENARLHQAARAAERTAERERARFEGLFEKAPVAIAIQEGPEHVYKLANPVYRQFLGNRELLGLRRRDVLPDFARLSKILDDVYATGETYERMEQPFKVDRGDGQWVDCDFNIVCLPILDGAGRPSGVMTFGFEVTPLVRARQSVERLARDLEAAVRARDTFLAVASHELRTPLTTLQLVSDALAHTLEAGQLDPARLRARVHKVQLQAARLNTLVGDLLDVSRLGEGRLELQREEVDAAQLAREIAARCEEQLASAGCTLTVEAPRPVVGHWDRARLDQVITNLLSNAIKYGAGKPIAIAISGDETGACIAVRDRGIGVAVEDQARIFERFERAVSERNFGGLGLGLWIAKQLVTAMGGTIFVASEPGGGAIFTVTLPLRPPG